MASLSRTHKSIFIFFFILFSFMHFYELDVRPLHHDEGVNGNFMKKLIVDNEYRYDPENYHGPSLYYFQLIPTWICGILNEGISNFDASGMEGLTPFSLRLGTAFIGVLLLLTIFLAYPAIGIEGALIAFVLAGFSCNILYFSRYFIHETYVLLFTMGIYLAGLYYLKTNRKIFFYIGVLSASFLFCTKETSVIIFMILFLSALLTETIYWILASQKLDSPQKLLTNKGLLIIQQLKGHIPLAISFGLAVWFFFFTSFFENLRGPLDSFRSYIYWTREGVDSGHIKPFPYYINDILIRYELAISIFAYMGMLIAVFRNNKKGLFLMFWTIGTIGFYSLTPYKTPWLVINLLLPMCLLAGFGFQSILDFVKTQPLAIGKKTGLFVLGMFALIPFLFQLPLAMKVVFREYDVDRHPQAYAHTSRSVYALLDEIDKYTNDPYGDKNINLNVFTEKYWPLPFYFRHYNYVHYYGVLEGITDADADLIIVDAFKKEPLDRLLKGAYTQKQYSLRPGVPLILYINNRILQKVGDVIPNLLSSVPRPQNLNPGLRKVSYKNKDFLGDAKEYRGDYSFNFWWNSQDKKPYESPFSLIWNGFLEIKNPGIYKFVLESDDGSWLTIDGIGIVDNGGEHINIRGSGKANLSAGLHRVEIKYFDIGGEAILKVYWTPPNETESIIPKDVFFSN